MENNIIINERVEKKHNFTIDIFKFVFSIFVILVHFPLPGEVGTICSTIGVTGVIFFFLISGYYAYNQDDSIACKNLMKRFKRNLILTFIVILIYFVVVIIENIISGDISSFFDN